MNEISVIKAPSHGKGIMERMAERYGLAEDVFRDTIRATCMPPSASFADFVACCMVAYEHGLNPITKEIYFMKTKGGSIQPIVSVDGWIRKCNEHPQFDGIEFKDELSDDGKPVSATCIIYRKDRTRPTIVTEYFDECSSNGGPVWKTAPKRMLRHRALTQAARYAFGFAGVMDRDEFDRWEEPKNITPATTANALPDIPDIPDIPEADVVTDLPVIDDEPDMIADVEGYLEKLEEDRSLCDSEDDVRELAAGNEDMIARLPAEAQAKARALLEVDE
jgi:phage recombination protein Bet